MKREHLSSLREFFPFFYLFKALLRYVMFIVLLSSGLYLLNFSNKRRQQSAFQHRGFDGCVLARRDIDVEVSGRIGLSKWTNVFLRMSFFSVFYFVYLLYLFKEVSVEMFFWIYKYICIFYYTNICVYWYNICNYCVPGSIFRRKWKRSRRKNSHIEKRRNCLSVFFENTFQKYWFLFCFFLFLSTKSSNENIRHLFEICFFRVSLFNIAKTGLFLSGSMSLASHITSRQTFFKNNTSAACILSFPFAFCLLCIVARYCSPRL